MTYPRAGRGLKLTLAKTEHWTPSVASWLLLFQDTGQASLSASDPVQRGCVSVECSRRDSQKVPGGGWARFYGALGSSLPLLIAFFFFLDRGK